MESPQLENRNELDAMVVNVELTLSSIVQGVALSLLADSARSVLSNGPRTRGPMLPQVCLSSCCFDRARLSIPLR